MYLAAYCGVMFFIQQGVVFMKSITVSLAFLILSGCSSVDNTVDIRPKNLHKIVAVATTDFDKNGDTCADATGIVEILHNKVVGSARDTFGRGFNVSGTIDASNKISGGFAITVITAVDYDGIMEGNGNKAKGTWKDLYNCSGTWQSQKIVNNS
jgi:uncharacterized protein YceK